MGNGVHRVRDRLPLPTLELLAADGKDLRPPAGVGSRVRLGRRRFGRTIRDAAEASAAHHVPHRDALG